jgi:hypothetical protein
MALTCGQFGDPAATLVNAVFFHILPTIVEVGSHQGSTATALYLPFSGWAFVGAAKDGVLVH